MTAGMKQDGRAMPAPSGLEQSAEVFARAARLAEALFAPAIAHVTLLADGEVWRSNDPSGRLHGKPIVAEYVVKHRKPLWVRDAARDRRFRDHPFVTGPQKLRLVVAMPIRLADG